MGITSKARENCRSYANTYLSRGKIKRLPCKECGTAIHLEMHHEDYSKPLEIIWLCHKHHRELHNQRLKENPLVHKAEIIPRTIEGKICGKCNNKNDRFPNRYCSDCHAKYMREWRKNNKMNTKQKKKDACRSYANVYLKRGKIKRGPCSVCGSIRVLMSHNDYNKPLDITWLCPKHHRMLNAKKRAEKKKAKILFSF